MAQNNLRCTGDNMAGSIYNSDNVPMLEGTDNVPYKHIMTAEEYNNINTANKKYLQNKRLLDLIKSIPMYGTENINASNERNPNSIYAWV